MQSRDHDPTGFLRARLAGGDAVVAGVLSGTSADGIDVVLARFSYEGGAPAPGRPVALAFETAPFPAAPGAAVRAILDGGSPSLGELARLDRALGHVFGSAARELAHAHGVPLDLVASHGQTVWHHDGDSAGAATLQLGDGCACAEAAGCAVASDFRRRDVAAGGEGAPLSALADELVFPPAPRPLHVLNLGGLSNLTCLAADGAPPVAFDTGPCGSLLDGLARRLLGRPFDADGEVAAAGAVRRDLLDAWLEHPFLDLPPPKSTGRDTFGERWIDGLLARARPGEGAHGGLEPVDVLRTAVELVAECVALGLRRFAPGGVDVPLVLAGGGIHNRTLVRALEQRTGRAPVTSSELGVDPDAREALVFAVLGARLVLGLPSTVGGVTRAAPGRVLGKLSLPASAPTAG